MAAQRTYSTTSDKNMIDKKPGTTAPASSGMSKSMHDGVEVWCDCCSCEAEPYWVEAMQQDEQAGKHK
jgi:hypothetical protein